MPQDAAARVRALLLETGFTAEGVLARVGAEAFAALGRDLQVPLRRALAQGPTSMLDHLVRLFLLADPVPAEAFPPELVDDLIALGMVRQEPAELVPLVEVRPYGEPDTDWFVVSDIGLPSSADHVLGAGGASLTLARITPRRPVERAWDLGCGAGVQVLHALRHAAQVVASDTNPRALALTSLSVALSGMDPDRLDLREGSLAEPVGDERFDLVVSNPPFVISPTARFTYRDAGMVGDELSRQVVRAAAGHLAPGGRAAVLGNWQHVAGQEWSDRVAGWVADLGVGAWIVQRDEQSPAEYAATWLRDAQVPEGPEFDAELDQWLDAFAAAGCTAVGFGWVVLDARDDAAAGDGAGHATSAAPSWVVVEDLSHAQRLPRGDEVDAFLGGCARIEAMGVPSLLGSRARLAEGTTITTTSHVAGGSLSLEPPRLGLAGSVGPGGWRPAVAVPPVLLAALQGDPDTPIGERVDAAAQAEGLDPLDVLGPVLTGLRELVRMGIVRTD